MHPLAFLICFLSCFIARQHADRIVFPNVSEEFPATCQLPDAGGAGVCRTSCDGEQAKKFKLCYFMEGQAYYCCQQPKAPVGIEQRAALRACQSSLPLDVELDFNLSNGKRVEVVRGIDTRPREFPYMAALGFRATFGSSEYDYKCGGVFISNRFVMTAAHCAYFNGEEPKVVLSGGVSLANRASARVFNVSRVVVHPEYVDDQVYHDIALIELAANTSVETACLWTRPDLDAKNLTAVGYGQILMGGASSDKLLKAYFQPIANGECQKSYDPEENMPYGIINMQLCAKDPENIRDTCQGDSGGPLIITETATTNTPQVVGITSFGLGCAQSPPGVYTRVSAYVDWIEGIVWPKST